MKEAAAAAAATAAEAEAAAATAASVGAGADPKAGKGTDTKKAGPAVATPTTTSTTPGVGPPKPRDDIEDPIAAAAARNRAAIEKTHKKKQQRLAFKAVDPEGDPDAAKTAEEKSTETGWADTVAGRGKRQATIRGGKLEYIKVTTRANPGKGPKSAVREGIITTLKSVQGSELVAIEGTQAKTVRNPGGVPNKW